MESIFEFDTLHLFLNAAMKRKTDINPQFSLSAWSRQLGFKNSSPLSLVLKGRRALPKKYLSRVAETLDLNKTEFEYLEVLAELAHSRSEEEELSAKNRLQKLRPVSKEAPAIIEAFKHLSNPLDAILLENVEKINFRLDPYWIQSQLQHRFEIDDIADAVHRLVELGLIQKTKNKYQKTYKTLTTQNDVVDYAAQEFHRSSLRIASQSLDRLNVEQREFQTFMLNIKPQDLTKAKKVIRKFIDDFIEEFECQESDFTATFLLMSQLLPVTKGGI